MLPQRLQVLHAIASYLITTGPGRWHTGYQWYTGTVCQLVEKEVFFIAMLRFVGDLKSKGVPRLFVSACYGTSQLKWRAQEVTMKTGFIKKNRNIIKNHKN
jgi:ribonuclease I